MHLKHLFIKIGKRKKVLTGLKVQCRATKQFWRVVGLIVLVCGTTARPFQFSFLIFILDSGSQTIQTGCRCRAWKCQEKFLWPLETLDGDCTMCLSCDIGTLRALFSLDHCLNTGPPLTMKVMMPVLNLLGLSFIASAVS